jgi:hypothetical protein
MADNNNNNNLDFDGYDWVEAYQKYLETSRDYLEELKAHLKQMETYVVILDELDKLEKMSPPVDVVDSDTEVDI